MRICIVCTLGGDRNDYTAIFETHNYIMRLKMAWRSGGGGRSIATQANQMALMTVIPQRAVANTDFPQNLAEPITAPPAGTNPPTGHAQHCSRGSPLRRGFVRA